MTLRTYLINPTSDQTVALHKLLILFSSILSLEKNEFKSVYTVHVTILFLIDYDKNEIILTE